MFKIIKTEYYDLFRCLMDKCKDNCCDEQWIITIDGDTYEKYKGLDVPDLDKKISCDTHVILKENGKCPFILENGLCFWHKEYGEDYLSNTCKSYPRFVSSYGDLYVENIGLSCPASAQWIVALEHKCEIVEKIYFENESENIKDYAYTQEEILMRTVINILYKNELFEDGINELYQLFGLKDEVTFDGDVYSIYNLVFCNIAICYLFEHIMLESQNNNPNYIGVLNRICQIIKEIAENYSDNGYFEKRDEVMSDIIYKVMRIKDHNI